MEPFENGTAHLLAELRRIDLLLQRQVLRLRAANLLTEDQFRGLYIPDAQVDALLRHARKGVPEDSSVAGAAQTTDLIRQLEKETEGRLRATAAAGIELPLPRLAAAFGLTRFDVEVLLIAVAPELDLRYQTLYAYAQNDVTKKHASVDLILNLLCGPVTERLRRRAVFASGAPVQHHLVRVVADPHDCEPLLLARFVHAEERIVDYLLESDTIDACLLPFTRRVVPTRRLDDLVLAPDLRTRFGRVVLSITAGKRLCVLQGPTGVGKQALAEAVCAERQLPLLVVDLERMGTECPATTLAALVRREAVLQGAAIYLRRFERLASDDASARAQRLVWAQALASCPTPVFVGTELPWQPDDVWASMGSISLDVPLPSYPLRLRLWAEAVRDGNGHLPSASIDLSAVSSKFVLSAGQIGAAAQAARTRAALHEDCGHAEPNAGDLHAAARAESGQGLQRLARKIEPVYTWSDIVLPPRALQQLREVCAAVKYRHVVYSTWGFDRRLATGKGLNVLFCGPSGTGKTMAAQILAHELGLDLYKIDLASVVSKYIGETEKNLSQVFREALSSNAILFFDEADALFGKRSEVKDAHDRYANIEVAYLLQKMEEYEGITILATNLGKNLDDAFARRMHHMVELPLPDALQRERIWRKVFPSLAPLGNDVDLSFMAQQLEFTGGNIRNVALAAAIAAAQEAAETCGADLPANPAIRMGHVVVAAARELRKMGRLPSKAEFRGYYELTRDGG
jgi:hypothetical protein